MSKQINKKKQFYLQLFTIQHYFCIIIKEKQSNQMSHRNIPLAPSKPPRCPLQTSPRRGG